MKRTSLASLVLGPALLLAALLAPGTVAAAGPISSTACTPVGPGIACDLWAKSGTLALPGGPVTIWGFSQTAGGSPTLPGPTLIVNQGDAVTVNLTNTLSQATSILFTGQSMVPDQTGAAALGGTKSYTFTATTPGTYLYEAGLIPGSQYQVAMGLHGVLIVRPTGQPMQAYGDAATAFNDEALVVVSEIDPALNNSGTPWTVDLRAYAPKYFLMNGLPYTSASPSITTASGNKLLLRYANAGIQHHSLGVLGLHQSVVGSDGSQLPAPRTMVAETLAPGQTADVLVSMPAAAAASTKYALYDAAMALNNSNANGIGGMLAIIDATGTAGGDVAGPTTTGVTLTQTTPTSGLYTVTASVSDAATGNAVVQEAEVRADAAPAGPFPMTAADSNFDTATEAVTSAAGQIDTTTWVAGTHTVFVRGRDANGNWGPYASATVAIDRTGPTTSALTLNPNPSSGLVGVALAGTASDVASGNNNVVAAEYWIGTPGLDGAGTPMNLNKLAPTVSISWTIPAPGPSGGVVSVHSKDSAGNWGAYTTINLIVDSAGPTTSGVSANPGANNGSYGQSGSNPSVRVSATLSDVASGGARIAAGEGFIDVAVANGTGFPFYATDGTFSSPSEAVYADIPLTTINALPTGSHTIRVHGKDAVGNWGAEADLTYVIDRAVPTFPSISLAPNPTNGSTTVTMTVNGASDPPVGGPASGVAGGEYWIGTTVPAAGSGTKFSGSTATIPVGSLATGTYTIGARVRDFAGNWSTDTRTATVLVVPDAIFSNGFETGTGPTSTWGWTSKSTNTASRLTVTTTSPMVGLRMLQAQGNAANYVQWNSSAANPATTTYDARFYFNPNGNAAGTGHDIFAAATTSGFGTQLFHVRYRMSAGQSQVQIQVGATANASWFNLTNAASNRIEVVWQSATSLQLHVNGTLVQTIVTANAGSVGAVRLGSVTNGGSNILEFFDGFTSKRTVSPLIGTGP